MGLLRRQWLMLSFCKFEHMLVVVVLSLLLLAAVLLVASLLLDVLQLAA